MVNITEWSGTNEEKQVHGRADCICIETGRIRAPVGDVCRKLGLQNKPFIDGSTNTVEYCPAI
jgi:hypothetical protein